MVSIVDTATALDNLKAVCPHVVGLSHDGRIDFEGDVPAGEKAAAAAWLASFQPTAAPRVLSKLTVIDRLNKAGLFKAAFTALGGPGALLYERWSAASEVNTKDPDVLALLGAIGADVQTVLAPEGAVVAQAAISAPAGSAVKGTKP